MDKSFRLPPSKKCNMRGCDHNTTPEDEIQMPFKGKTLLLSLCPNCGEALKKLPQTGKLNFTSFSGNGYRYVEEAYPANP